MTSNPTASKLRAVIWDMDGVIADTGRYHLEAWQKVFRKRGVEFTAAAFKGNFGQRNDTIIKNTLGDNVAPADIATFTREKETAFRRRAGPKVEALPGATELIGSLKEHGVKQAMGSSAPIENIRLVTRRLGIAGYFDAVVAGQEVSEGKPSPLGFLLAARKLGVSPGHCLVIEDSIAGITAGKRAGMCCLAVTNTHPRESLRQADCIVDSLEDVTISSLEGLF